ncbi:MAG TPA: Txe/YoeB family addiction module toxin [Caulobacteraceae bacterium]|nr:Txe/YoeB family addiction module toxin [Caulobacteraceae bacterium]
MKIVWASHAWDDYLSWRASDPAVFDRLNALINEGRRTPFTGTGKPEPLRESLRGWWSRRITVGDRLVYRVSGKPPDQMLEIAQCRFHY